MLLVDLCLEMGGMRKLIGELGQALQYQYHWIWRLSVVDLAVWLSETQKREVDAKHVILCCLVHGRGQVAYAII